MRNCLTCPFRSFCRRTPADLLEAVVESDLDACPDDSADRVLASLTPSEIERIARNALITLDPETDFRAIAKAELIEAIEALDWNERPSLK